MYESVFAIRHLYIVNVWRIAVYTRYPHLSRCFLWFSHIWIGSGITHIALHIPDCEIVCLYWAILYLLLNLLGAKFSKWYAAYGLDLFVSEIQMILNWNRKSENLLQCLINVLAINVHGFIGHHEAVVQYNTLWSLEWACSLHLWQFEYRYLWHWPCAACFYVFQHFSATFRIDVCLQ